MSGAVSQIHHMPSWLWTWTTSALPFI